ncbi:unnamed protein product [Rhizophagus irregularis]|uniref:Uncharacterized protein n=1 Tax=Rhizophagus irregularis TaxID=588596 RepID=A0A2I1EUN5_9GLOM|nr:hypothetical protein RhiirB3_440948 [Rhizophagus irregularis]CAB5308578.1 unnamed protein product [Rhizophagus irregularis]
MKLKRINHGVVRIYFENDQGNHIRIPSGIRLWDTSNNVGIRRESLGGYQFFSISWVHDYEMTYNGEAVYVLTNQKQQSAQGSAIFTYSVEENGSDSEDHTDNENESSSEMNGNDETNGDDEMNEDDETNGNDEMNGDDETNGNDETNDEDTDGMSE